MKGEVPIAPAAIALAKPSDFLMAGGFAVYSRVHPAKARNCRFPPPWLVDELEACFVVMHGSGSDATRELHKKIK